MRETDTRGNSDGEMGGWGKQDTEKRGNGETEMGEKETRRDGETGIGGKNLF
jgi:hypothetical protein